MFAAKLEYLGLSPQKPHSRREDEVLISYLLMSTFARAHSQSTKINVISLKEKDQIRLDRGKPTQIFGRVL